MKFWKSLSILIEDTLPEWRDKFLSYKDLKKQLKLIYPKSGAVGGGGDVTKEVIDFVRLLEDEMEKLNSFIVEKEEDSVIKWKVRDVVPLYELQDGVAEARDSKEELMRIGREIVDLHGEMILLENYSALNYTGLVKILKKYDKRSGALLRVPFIRKVTQQPFFTTHVLNKLVKECEATLDSMFTRNEPATTVAAAASSEAESRDQSSCEATTVEEERSFKQTLSALRVLKEVRSGSSTVNMFSLPPLPSQSMEDDWKKVSVVEQAAK
ncbi:SPX domain-containing protein 1 [Linum perenne]